MIAKKLRAVDLCRLPSVLALTCAAGIVASCGGAAPPAVTATSPQASTESVALPAQLRVMSQEEYANAIKDLFGPDIVAPPTISRAPRVGGLMTIGAGVAGITPSMVEQFHRNAQNVAAQVVDVKRRETLFPCKPVSVKSADTACAEKFISAVGRKLFRRPLTEAERKGMVAIADENAARVNDFYAGVAYTLAGMLSSPEFIFIADTSEPDPQQPGKRRLTGYAKAIRLSLFFWDSIPDEALLQAAERGDLHTKRGLVQQVDRLVSSQRLERGVRAFFSDMLALESFEDIAKDNVIYPALPQPVLLESKEQMLRMIAHHIVTERGDYRDLFNSRKTFMTPHLATVSGIVAPSREWTEYEFPADNPRVGLLSQIGFVSLYAHPGRSSPTRRGKAIRELVLCQKVPDPPPNVDFSGFEDPRGNTSTARDRLTAHATNPVCAGCHKITDPIGLSLENFDGAGQFRATEGNAPIDPSGSLDGVAFSNPAGLGRALHDSPAVTSCLVSRLYSFAVGKVADGSDQPNLARLQAKFAAVGYRVPDLMRAIVDEGSFFELPSKATPVAAAN